MEKLFKHAFLFACSVALFAACSSDNMSDGTQGEPIDNSSKVETIKFIYNGETHAAEYTLIDSTVVYLDQDINKLMQEISEKPNLELFMHEDGTFEYFESREAMEKSVIEAGAEVIQIDSTDVDVNSSRCISYYRDLWTLTFYDYAYGRGQCYSVKETQYWGVSSPLSDLNRICWNDRISSIRFNLTPSSLCSAAIATFHENALNQMPGATFSVRLDVCNRSSYLPNLACVPIYRYGCYPTRSWDNQISAITVTSYRY